MSKKTHYIYDKQSCTFVPVQYNRLEVSLFSASLWILNGFILAGTILAILSSFYGTPAELALKAENQTLLRQLTQTREEIQRLESRMDKMAELDNEMYRSILGLEPIPEEARNAGIGGSRIYEEFDFYSAETSDILLWINSTIDNLDRRIEIQNMSFEEIKAYYNENTERMKHIPVIKPVDNIVISAYGMRDHPVFGYKRMHEGVDFRSEIGSPVYSTGDGTIRLAATRGTYGRMISIDHGFGFESRYAHLSGYAEGIRSGKNVKRGDLIGFTGKSGVVSGPHLHYEILLNGTNVNPLQYLFADITPEEFKLYQELMETEHASLD